MILGFFFTLLGFSIYAEDLGLDDRMFDAESSINTIKEDVARLKELNDQEKPNSFNPSMSVTVDLLGQYGFNVKSDGDFKNGFLVREAEAEFKAEVDPFCRGVLSLAFSQESHHKFHLHIEEAYGAFDLFGMGIKLGRFRSSFGRVNLLHLHALHQTYQPHAAQAFLGEEALFANGISLFNNFPLAENHNLMLSLEGSWLTKTDLQDKGAEKAPSGLMRLWWHSQYGDADFLDVGISNFMGRKGEQKSGLFNLIGFDFHYAYKPGYLKAESLFLLGHESFLAISPKTDSQYAYGNFTWAQVRLFAGTFLGVRHDLFPGDSSLKHAASAYMSYYTSEFLRFRVGYEHVMPKLSSIDGEDRIMFGLVFTMGAHPQDPYIVNR